MKTWFAIIFLGVITLLSATQASAQEVLFHYVTDKTGTLSEQESRILDEMVTDLEKNAGIQFKILLINTTGSESIESFSEKTFARSKLGDKGKDNGLLLVIALQDRKMRFEIGYGLEGTITDLVAGRIIAEQLVPAFKRNAIALGISESIKALYTTFGLELNPSVSIGVSANGVAPVDTTEVQDIESSNNMPFTPLLMFAAVISHLIFKRFIKMPLRIFLTLGITIILSIVLTFSQGGSITTDYIQALIFNLLVINVVAIPIVMYLTHLHRSRSGTTNTSFGGRSRSSIRSSSRSGSRSSSRSGSSGRGGRSGGGGASGSW